MVESIPTATLEEFKAECKAQDVPRAHIAFKCPICGSIQSGQDFIDAGAGKTFDDIEKYLAFSCIGRFLGMGSGHSKDRPKGAYGCDWSLGGLFQLHKAAVVTPDGKVHPRFELVTPVEAQLHMERKKAHG